MVRALNVGYKSDEFQRRLHAGWHSVDDPVERARWRKQVCLEVQGPIISQYGFEPSRRGVWEIVQAFRGSLNYDEEIWPLNVENDWLTDPDLQASDPCRLGGNKTSWVTQCSRAAGWEPSPPALAYRMVVTQPDEPRAVDGVEACQGALAGAHQALYRHLLPGVQQEEWLAALGCQSVQDSLEAGVLILRAETETRQVVGYVSCSCTYESLGEAAAARAITRAVPHAKVNHIAVLPQHRGSGVGRMLFEELLAHLSSASPSVAGDLRICAVRLNDRALGWYRRLGFVEVDEREVLFPSGCGSVRFVDMQRVLR